jgi:hypothetical protein
MTEFVKEFLLSCWIASVIVTFIVTHKLTSRASEREIADQRALIDKLHAALMARRQA